MERKNWTPLLLHPCKELWWITGRTRTCNLQSLSLALSEFMYQFSPPVSSTNQQPGDHEHKKVTKSVICWAAATVVCLPTIQGSGFFVLKVLRVVAHKNILPRERSCLFQATQDEKYMRMILLIICGPKQKAHQLQTILRDLLFFDQQFYSVVPYSCLMFQMFLSSQKCNFSVTTASINTILHLMPLACYWTSGLDCCC